MAVTSVTQIQNSALIKLGAERIISEDDNSNRAKLVKEQYPKVRDMLLRSHPWKFATYRATLAEVTPKPDTVFDFDHVFALPADCLRVIETSLTAVNYLSRWQIEGRQLMCDSEAVTIKYIGRVADVSQFDDNFCEVLALALADDISYAITQSTSLRDSIKKDYNSALMVARSFNAQQGSVQRVEAEEFINSRYR